MIRPPLSEFLTGEVDDFVRSESLAVMDQLGLGQRCVTYNAFNVLLDGEACTATVEDELDVNRETTIGLDEFRVLLVGGDAP